MSLTYNKTDGLALIGETVWFTCTAASLPLASYEIRHNNVLIRNSTNQVYKIASVSLADEGTYTCLAYNYLGYSATSSSNLTVYGKSFIAIICACVGPTTILLPARVAFSACADLYSNCAVAWIFRPISVKFGVPVE